MSGRGCLKTKKNNFFVCYKNDFLSETLIKYGAWEDKLINRAEGYLKDDSVILDIGAHIGTWSVELAKNARKIYAFEPYKPSYMALCGNIFVNDKNHQIEVFNAAITDDTTKKMGMKMMDDNNSCSCKLVETDGTNTVKLMTIDELNLTKLDFIKLDIEGHEFQALKGGANTIAKFKPIIFFDCWQWDAHKLEKEKLLNFLTKLGYNVNHVSLCSYDNYEAIPENIKSLPISYTHKETKDLLGPVATRPDPFLEYK